MAYLPRLANVQNLYLAENRRKKASRRYNLEAKNLFRFIIQSKASRLLREEN